MVSRCLLLFRVSRTQAHRDDTAFPQILLRQRAQQPDAGTDHRQAEATTSIRSIMSGSCGSSSA